MANPRSTPYIIHTKRRVLFGFSSLNMAQDTAELSHVSSAVSLKQESQEEVTTEAGYWMSRVCRVCRVWRFLLKSFPQTIPLFSSGVR